MVKRCQVCDKWDPELQELSEAICIRCLYWAAAVGHEFLIKATLKALHGKEIGRC